VKAQDVLPLDRQTLELWFGQRTGVWLFDKVRGISRTPVRRARRCQVGEPGEHVPRRPDQ
jgi:hypothetical protein